MSLTQTAMLAVAVAGLMVVVLSTLQRRRRSKRQRTSYVRELQGKWKPEASAVREVEDVMAELDQLARNVHGQIDARLARLERLIREADQRIDRLSRSVRTADGEPSLDVTLASEAPAEADERRFESASDSLHEAVCRLADSGLSAVAIAQQVHKTTGEVELILALRRVRQAEAQSPDGLYRLDSAVR